MQHIYSYYNQSNSASKIDFKYCPYCQTELMQQDSGGLQRPTCPACDFVHYRNPLPAVCVAILDGGRILLGKRAEPPGQGLWAIPSGYIEFEDDFLSTAIQEAKEETGLDVEIRSIFNVLSSFYSPRYHFLVVYVIADVVGGQLKAGDDMDDVGWFTLDDELPDLAFTEDRDALKAFSQRRYPALPIENIKRS